MRRSKEVSRCHEMTNARVIGHGGSRALNRPNLSSYFLNEFKLAPLVILGDQVADDVR